jgi:hypothetical protein
MGRVDPANLIEAIKKHCEKEGRDFAICKGIHSLCVCAREDDPVKNIGKTKLLWRV